MATTNQFMSAIDANVWNEVVFVSTEDVAYG
jgi:hypothetical protein